MFKLLFIFSLNLLSKQVINIFLKSCYVIISFFHLLLLLQFVFDSKENEVNFFFSSRKDEENTDFKRYVSDCVEMQSPFKSETERSESCKLPDASNESLLRVYEKILNEKR